MEPQSLQASQGWQWIKQGYALFMKAPLLWIVLLVICFIAVAGLSAVPVVASRSPAYCCQRYWSA